MEYTGRNKIEEVYKYVRSKILNMEYIPGAIISENTIAKELKISRTPIREAFKKLEMEGLIVTLPSKRKQIFLLTMEDVRKIFDIKKSLEGSIAKWAVERGVEEDFIKLKEIIEDMERIAQNQITSIEDENFKEWLQRDNDFHELLFKMANNDRAELIIKNLNAQWHRLRLGILAIEGRISISTREHKEIAEAILAKNSQRAEELMKGHLSNLEKLLINLMKTFNYP